MADKISSLDIGYVTGQLSIFPEAIDTRETLYEAKNNSISKLAQSLGYIGKFIVLVDANSFSDSGIVRIDKELIFYGSKTGNILRDLKRGFATSKQSPHQMNATVTGSVMAEHHNAIKDAIINIENDLGKDTFPATSSLNGILSDLETNYLAPKPKFRAFPFVGAPPLKVRFQNLSGGPPIRFLWDFGDGTTSAETSPIHTYQREGLYTVKLSMITSLGAQGFITKKEYIRVDVNEELPLFYAETLTGTSIKTAGSNATVFKLVDQTDGDISGRYWIWDDDTNESIEDPDIHTATHSYAVPGNYEPTLLVVFTDGRLKRLSLEDTLTVT